MTDETTDHVTHEAEPDRDLPDHDLVALEELEGRLAELEQELESLERSDAGEG